MVSRQLYFWQNCEVNFSDMFIMSTKSYSTVPLYDSHTCTRMLDSKKFIILMSWLSIFSKWFSGFNGMTKHIFKTIIRFKWVDPTYSQNGERILNNKHFSNTHITYTITPHQNIFSQKPKVISLYKNNKSNWIVRWKKTIKP